MSGPILVDPRTGAVTHRRECDECGGEGFYEDLCRRHGRGCDCGGPEVTCERCDGERFIDDDECGCEQVCMAALDAWLEREHSHQKETR